MKRTGVIVGMDPDAADQNIIKIVEALEGAFPGVKFAVVAGAQSVAFEYTPPAPEPGEPIRFDPEFIDDPNKYDDEQSGDYFGASGGLWGGRGRK